MAINTSNLKTDKFFENEKIKILFSIGSVSNSLEVYLKDEIGKMHHILWEISPDRSRQSFDKANDKIRDFVKNIIEEWLNDEEEVERLREEAIQKKKETEENELKELIDSF